jgi:hypothetical protein
MVAREPASAYQRKSSSKRAFEDCPDRFRLPPYRPDVGIAPDLNENVEYNPVLIDGATEIVLHAKDPDEDFVHVLLVARLRSAAAHAVGETGSELRAPASHSSYETAIPRSARINSTSRRLRLNTRYSQTACLMISTGNRWR